MHTVLISRRRLVLLVAAALVTMGATGWWIFGRAAGQGSPPGLGTRTVQAGAVEVRMTALTLDRSGAVFAVKLDTHTVALDLDVAGAAQLRVKGSTTSDASWDGSGPGGHHREGRLRFTTPVPAGAEVELRITGLPQDATGTWSAP